MTPQQRPARLDAAPGTRPGTLTSSWVHGPFLALVGLSAYMVKAPWAGFHGAIMLAAGLLVMLRPPVAAVPRLWWVLGAAFVVLGASAFLPAAWFGMPDWRATLESLGFDTGNRVVIQQRHAFEMLALFALMVLVGLWLTGHRASPATLRGTALAFCLAVAAYAVVSRVLQQGGEDDPNFGFFPNRNHSASYLAMGAVCGFGCILQFGRDKRFVLLGLAIAATFINFWAVGAWSVSRAGVVLVALGLLLWLPMLGWRYLGRHGLWTIGLILLAVLGFFLVAETRVKERIRDTMENATAMVSSEPILETDKKPLDGFASIDLRIPIFLDTLDLIGDFPLTGLGAGQYPYVFPQYRNLSAVAQDADAYHPESSWLWLAAELGVPATVCLIVLVLAAAITAARAILSGRDRALRASCLAAALLLPIHGFFDVPAHRITLAWTAALLFSLSLRPPNRDESDAAHNLWPARLCALPLLLAAAILLAAQWSGRPNLATTVAARTLAEARHLHQIDQQLQQAAREQGLEYQPDPAEDKLEHALRLIEHARKTSPLDRRLPRFEAYLALHFDDKIDRIEAAYSLDLELDPMWVAGPLRQAESIAYLDPSRATPRFREAIARSVRLGTIDPENRWNSPRTREFIRLMALRNPDLEEAARIVEVEE